MTHKGKYYESQFEEAKQIAAEADRLSREVCPALLQHVINTR